MKIEYELYAVHNFRLRLFSTFYPIPGKANMDDTIKIFICADEDDLPSAKKLYDDLKLNGVSPWLEQETWFRARTSKTP